MHIIFGIVGINHTAIFTACCIIGKFAAVNVQPCLFLHAEHSTGLCTDIPIENTRIDINLAGSICTAGPERLIGRTGKGASLSSVCLIGVAVHNG